MVVVLFNVCFAFFQAGLPRDSALRLYQDFDAGFGGLFANTNHQATACIIGMVLAVGLAVEARMRVARGDARPHTPWWYAATAVLLLLLVPLSTARAGMAIALPMLALALFLTGALPVARLRRSKRSLAVVAVVALLAVIGVRAAMGWMAVDQAEELRHTMAMAALEVGQAHAPLGSGVGSFVQAFEQSAPDSLWLANYINHAHNEYAQWWLTSGWLGMLVLTVTVLLLAVCGWNIARLRGGGRGAVVAAACFTAICAVLAHSWADYPLRTTTLMATTAALAGIMLSALGDAMERSGRMSAPRTASQTQPSVSGRLPPESSRSRGVSMPPTG